MKINRRLSSAMSFERWMLELRTVMRLAGYTEKAVSELKEENYRPYFNDDKTPGEVVLEELAYE